MWIATILNIIASATLIIFTDFITFIIYYVVRSCCEKIYSNGVYESLFSSIKNSVLQNNKKEHHLIFSLYNHGLNLVAFGLAFLFYNLIPNQSALSILILILSLGQILSVYFLSKSDNIEHIEEMKYS